MYIHTLMDIEHLNTPVWDVILNNRWYIIWQYPNLIVQVNTWCESGTCPNAWRQSARRTPSERSTGRFLLKVFEIRWVYICKHPNRKYVLSFNIKQNKILLKPKFRRQLWKNLLDCTIKVSSCLQEDINGRSPAFCYIN